MKRLKLTRNGGVKMIIKVEYKDGSFVEFRSYKNTKFKGRMRDYEGVDFEAKSEDISLSFFLDFAFETTKEVKACYLTKNTPTGSEYVNSAFTGELLAEWEMVTRKIRKEMLVHA